MAFGFGVQNSALTKAVRRLAAADSNNVRFTLHALAAMDEHGFDHDDVMTCLRKGTAIGPELQNNELRANVIHRGLGVRVVIGGIDDVGANWERLRSVRVVTVMEGK